MPSPHQYFGSNVLYQESPEYPCMVCALASRIFRVERFVSGKPGTPMHDLYPRLTHISGRTFCFRKARYAHALSVPSPHAYVGSNVLCKESREYPCMICASPHAYL